MANSITRKISISEWRKAWRGTNPKMAPHIINFCSSRGPSGTYHEGWRWCEGKKMYVFREASVPQRSVQSIIKGINSLIQRIGLNIQIKNFDTHESIQAAIDYATKSKEEIDGDLFGSYLLEESYRDSSRGGIPHADVLVTDKYLTLGRENWGQSAFYQGYMIISLPGARQKSLDFITNIATHEAGHLLGFQRHHDDPDIEVEGYPEVNDCVMYWRASTREICPRCEDAIRYFWMGLQDKTSLKFFKRYNQE